MCEHQVNTKVENGMVITYCTKCGAILDTKVCSAPSVTCGSWNEGGLKDNGGQILHD